MSNENLGKKLVSTLKSKEKFKDEFMVSVNGKIDSFRLVQY